MSTAETPIVISLSEVLIDFEACPIGTMPSYTEDGTLVTSTSGDLRCFTLAGTCSGTCAIGLDGTFKPVRTDFPTLVSEVSADMGDQSPDLDVMFMEAYNESDVLVDSEVLDCGTCIGSFTLSVSGPNIAYIITGSDSTINESSVAVDNIRFTPQETIVGGELLSIDSTALILAGAQTNAVWIMSALAVIGSVAFSALYITSKRN